MASLQTYLFTRLLKTFRDCEPKVWWPRRANLDFEKKQQNLNCEIKQNLSYEIKQNLTFERKRNLSYEIKQNLSFEKKTESLFRNKTQFQF